MILFLSASSVRPSFGKSVGMSACTANKQIMKNTPDKIWNVLFKPNVLVRPTIRYERPTNTNDRPPVKAPIMDKRDTFSSHLDTQFLIATQEQTG